MGILRVDTIQDGSGNPYPIPEGGGTDRVFYENGQTVTTNYTISEDKNAFSAGPITINSGAVVTIPEGSTWQVGSQESSESTFSGADAWGSVDSNGTLGGGLNIASVTRTSLGTYDVVFATPMPNADYSVSGSSAGAIFVTLAGSKSTSGFTYQALDASPTLVDYPCDFSVFSRNASVPRGGTGADAWARCNGAGLFNATFNFSSIVRNSQGVYTLTFASPMPDTSYAVVTGSDDQNTHITCVNRTTTSLQLQLADPAAAGVVDANFSVVVHATNAALPASYTGEQIQGLLDTAPKAMLQFTAFTNGTVLINRNFNIASVVFVGVSGQYDITFTNPIPGVPVLTGMGAGGISNGGASFVNIISGTGTGTRIGTLSTQPNASLAQEGSTNYSLVWF